MFYKKMCETCGTIFYCEGDLCRNPASGFKDCHCKACSIKDSWGLCKKHMVTNELLEKIAIEEL